jgi:hypothetical protein
LAGKVFFPPRQSAFDASPVHAQPPLFPQLLCKSGSTKVGIFRLLFLNELHDLLTQLVCPPGTTLLRQQPCKTILLERGLRFIKRRPRETELGGSLGNAASLYRHLAQHLVLHLHQILGVEEIVGAEQIVANALRARIEATVLAQCRCLTRVFRSAPFLCQLASMCKYNYAAYDWHVKAFKPVMLTTFIRVMTIDGLNPTWLLPGQSERSKLCMPPPKPQIS